MSQAEKITKQVKSQAKRLPKRCRHESKGNQAVTSQTIINRICDVTNQEIMKTILLTSHPQLKYMFIC